MEPEKILSSSFIDILFENRNKEYGAYDLRKGYFMRLMMGVVTTIIIVIAFIVFFPSQKILNAINHKPPFFDYVVDTIKLIPQPKPLQVARPKAATIKYSATEISKTGKGVMPPIDDLIHSNIGTETIEGPPTDHIQAPGVNMDSIATKAVEPLPEPVEKILSIVEKMPEFPGGDGALRRFLSKNLRVPEETLEPGSRIKMQVRFVVDSDGSITGIQFVQSPGLVFEEEILRVMKKMPKWKPGIQNGKNVSVYFQIPIIFEIPE